MTRFQMAYLIFCVMAGIGIGWLVATPQPFAIWHPAALSIGMSLAAFFGLEGAAFTGGHLLVYGAENLP